MTDLTDVLHRATDDLAPDSAHDLVSGAVRRGARLRRRRRATTVAAYAAGLAVVATAGVAALQRQDAGTATDPGFAAPTHVPALSPPKQSAARPGLAIDRDQVGATFASILPGTVTGEVDDPASEVPPPGGYSSEFQWEGVLVSVKLTPFRGDAHAKCLSVVEGDVTCVRVDGGWAVHDPHVAETDLNRWASVYRDNGWQLWVLDYNSSGEKGAVGAGTPPLGVPELTKVATSDLWFE